jgi:hypothetical protein
MGIARGLSSTFISRAESPVHSGVLRQPTASLERTFSPQLSGVMSFLGRCPRLVYRRAVGPEESHLAQLFSCQSPAILDIEAEFASMKPQDANHRPRIAFFPES